MNGFMNGFGWQPARFAGNAGVSLAGRNVRRPRLSQADEAAWADRARAAVEAFDLLSARAQQIGNPDARRAIFEWVSTPGVPGTPAERYKVVVDDLTQGTPWAEISQKRVSDLELMDTMFDTKVKQAEQSYAPISQPEAPGVTASRAGALSTTGIVLGAVGILGLLVVPLVIGE